MTRARVIFILPIKRSGAPCQVSYSQNTFPVLSTSTYNSAMKFLYVEDDLNHVALTRRALEDDANHSFELVHVETIAAALDYLESHPNLELILSDLRLPDGSGLDLLAAIKRRKAPPAVVLVTGQGDEQVAVAALKAGAADYLVKQSDYLHRLSFALTNAVAQNHLLRRESALREAEIRYQSLIEQTPAIVFLDSTLISSKSATIYISPRLEEFTGYSSIEWLTHKYLWEDLIHSNDRERIIEAYRLAQQNSAPFDEEYQVVRRDGSVIWVKEVIDLIKDEYGDPLYWQGVLFDITKDKQTENALQRQLKQLTVLHTIAVAGADSDTEDEIIGRVVRIASQIYNEVCGVLLLSEDRRNLIPHSSYIGANTLNWAAGIEITKGVTGRSALLEKTIRIGDVAQEATYIEIATRMRSELCVPIRVNTRVIGIFNVESKIPNAFDQEDEQFINTVASSLGTALERLRLAKEEQRHTQESLEAESARRKQAENLQEAIAALSTTLDIQELYQIIFSSLSKLVIYDSASVFFERENDSMEIVAAHGFDHVANIIGKTFPKSAKWSEIAALRKPLILSDAQTDPRFEAWDESKYIRGWMGVPMIAQDRVIGFINLDSHHTAAFTAQDATVLQTFASSAAIAIENTRSYGNALQAAERRVVLHQISQEIISFSQDFEQIYVAIHAAAKKLMPCDVFIISLRNAEKGVNDFVYRIENGQRLPFESFASNAGLTTQIATTGQSVILQNEREIAASPATRFGSSTHVLSAVFVPMRIDERIIGSISAQSYEPNAYHEEEQALLEILASSAATAIENTRLFNETQNRFREMETINRLSTALRKANSQAEIFEIFIDETLRLLGEENGAIWIYDHVSDKLVQHAARGMAKNAKHKQLNTTGSIVAHVFTAGEAHISPKLSEDPLTFLPNFEPALLEYGGISIPITSTAGTLGSVFIQMAPGRQFAQHTSLLTTLAEIAGNAIHRIELYDHSQEQIRRLTALRDIDSAIASSADLRVTLNILGEHTLKHLKVDAIDILLYRPELQNLTYLYSAGFNSSTPANSILKIGDGLASQILFKGKTHQVINLANSSELKNNPMLRTEGFVSYIGIPLIVKGQVKGVFEAFHRTAPVLSADWMQFLQTLAGQAAIAIDNAHLFENLQKSNQEIIQAYDITLEGWARALELRDRETEGHTRRVTELTMRLAKSMGLSDEELANIYRGVLLHDIGKMGVPDQILRKTGPLTETEWEEMRRHPQYAYDLLSPIHYLHPSLDIPYCHHEHWDGSGYPRGLKGEQIPLAARIFSVVDVWDALRSDRPYRKAWPTDQIIQYIKDNAGILLDPDIVRRFLTLLSADQL